MTTPRNEARKHYRPRKPRECKPRTDPSNYRPWTPADEARLRRMVPRGHDDGYIASHLGRPRGDVNAKIKALGLEDKWYEPDPANIPETARACLSCDQVFYSRYDHICPTCKSHVEFQEPFHTNYRQGERG